MKAAALNPIHGADRVARFFIGIANKSAARGVTFEIRAAAINGATGLLLFRDGQIDSTISIATDGAHIAAIYMVRNPAKLDALAAAAT